MVVRLVAVKLVVALAIFVTLEVKSLTVEDCHWMVPTFPLKVSEVLFVPVQTVVLPAIVPPTDAGLTVTATDARVADGQLEALIVDHEISTCPLPD